MLAELKKASKIIHIEHFESYAKGSDNSPYPCGAGRGYIGIDTDGSMWPCHRFIKFTDTRHWSEKEWCFGHVEHGITKPGVRDKFINFKSECSGSECYRKSPCHGGCYAVNLDNTGDIMTPDVGVCAYVKMQLSVSAKYKDLIGLQSPMPIGKVTPQDVVNELRLMGDRLYNLEVSMNSKLNSIYKLLSDKGEQL
jgi:radical SAM protein with 4Fe4S-binding SPASM domain